MAYEQTRFRVVLKPINYILQTIFMSWGFKQEKGNRLSVKTKNMGVLENKSFQGK